MSLSNCWNYFLKIYVFRNSANPDTRSKPGVSAEIDPAGAVIGLESAPVEVHVDNHPSILDIDIPDSAKVNDDVEVTEAQNMKRQESFLTEVEEFTQTPVVETELETQLRPVFDLCQPNSEGLISIEHLRVMCREHGQVGTVLELCDCLTALFSGCRCSGGEDRPCRAGLGVILNLLSRSRHHDGGKP